MQITLRDDDGVTLVELQGTLDARGARDVEAGVAALLRTAGVRLALDCAQIDATTGAGLRALVSLSKRVLLVDGAVILYALDTNLLHVLDVAGLAEHFAIVPTAVDAIARLRAHGQRTPLPPAAAATRRLAARVLAALEGTDAPPVAARTLRYLRRPEPASTSALADRLVTLLSGKD
jgi:anti-anti-sigma factor